MAFGVVVHDMLIFIENEPRAYAWGSRDALAQVLGTRRTGEPQAELWLGAHPGDPAEIAKATPTRRTLIDLIESDPDRYGIDGGPLPFLLKVLAIGAPLSLQAHPNLEQAREGYAREEAAGTPRDARDRNYRDPNHKPELLVALTEVRALTGFRPLGEVRKDLALLAAEARGAGMFDDAEALDEAAMRLRGSEDEALRRDFIEWAFSDDERVRRVLDAMVETLPIAAPPQNDGLDAARVQALLEIADRYPGDSGLLVSLLLHHVVLQPGESVYLPARQLHAYLGGVGVEVMAASDNVLRAGLTEKHIDIPELCRVIDAAELPDPRFPCTRVSPGLVAWRAPVPDFTLMRARVWDPESSRPSHADVAASVSIDARAPLVLIAIDGRVRVERLSGELDEVASVRRGQSLYISAGAAVELTGSGEVFLATVGG